MGYCTNEDEDFLDNIHISANENTNDTIDCNPNIPYGTCEFCGEELKEYVEWHPYGDIEVPMKSWYCECD